jgi:hypothetical protein
VNGPSGDLHTHQVINGNGSTTVVNEAQSQVMKGEVPASTMTIPLKDAEAAQKYQKSQIGQPLGCYDERSNSCVDHVANVLRAGGEDVPSGASSQMEYMARKAIKIKG